MSKRQRNNFDSSTKVFIWQGWFSGGGAPEVTLALARTIRNNFRVDPTLGVFKKNNNYDFSQIKAPRIFPTKRLQGYNHLFASYWLNTKGVLDNFDIVFAHAEGDWKSKNNFYVQHQAGDLDSLLDSKNVKSKLVYYPIYKISIRAIEKSDLIFYTTKKVEKFLERHSIQPRERTSSFVNMDHFIADTRNKKLPFKVLFAGSEYKRKNLTNLIEASRKINNLKLIVAGVSRKDKPGIEFLGWREDMAKLYNKVNLVCLPSQFEGFPLVLLEALISQTPVLISEIACPEELKPYVNLCGISKKSIEEGLRYSLNNYEELREKAHEGRKFVKNNFSKEKVLRKEISTILKYYEKRK